MRIVLAMNAVPAYSKVGPEESWSPNVISAQWTSARIVGSVFRVILGKPEKVDEFSDETSKTTALQGAQARVQSVTAYPIDSEILILNGDTDADGGDWHMTNPGESGVNTTYIPASGGVPGHFVAYQTTRLAPSTINGASAYPRVIDFRNIPTKNMSNASRSEILSASYIDPANGAAKAVIEPGTPCSDDWPWHVAIASVYTSTLSGWPYTSLLNAFVHTEDIYQFDQANPLLEHPTFARICYARSLAGTSDYGRQFSKTAHQNGYPIITYEYDEDAQGVFVDSETGETRMANRLYGVGCPSIIQGGTYYYMIYSTWSLRRSAGNLVYDVSGHVIPDPILSIARAETSAVNNNLYFSSPNPWKKYKEVPAYKDDPFHDGNWQEPGVEGQISGIWNAKYDAQGCRTDQSAIQGKWRAYGKVSYNTYLDGSYPDQVVLICKGYENGSTPSILIHTSSDLIHWSTESLIIIYDQKSSVSNYYSYEYPALVGVDPTFGGYSGQTCEYNKLYYQRQTHLPSGSISDQDLYRRTLRFQLQ